MMEKLNYKPYHSLEPRRGVPLSHKGADNPITLNLTHIVARLFFLP
jgi:hypothetical protein